MPNDSPLIIASTAQQGVGVRGALEFVKVYHKTIPPQSIMADAFGIAPKDAACSTAMDFDFAHGAGIEGWTTHGDAAIGMAENRLTVDGKTPNSLIINNHLNANIDKKDWVHLRMAVDRGGQAKLIFVATQGAGFIPFDLFADQKPHTYAIEPWTHAGWGGELLALGLVPSDAGPVTAKIERLDVAEAMPPPS